MKRIIQLLPAPLWQAAFATVKGDVELHPLVCFALMEDEEKDQSIQGFFSSEIGIIECEGMDNFIAYVNDEVVTHEVKEAAYKYSKRRAEIAALESDSPQF